MADDTHAPDDDVDIKFAPPLGRRWAIPGGHEDDGGLTLYFVVSSHDGHKTKRYEVELPVAVQGMELTIGTARIEATR